jgi:hypothetical protein
VIIPLHRKTYQYLIKLGWLPEPTEAEKAAARKHNKELAQRLSKAQATTGSVKNATSDTIIEGEK